MYFINSTINSPGLDLIASFVAWRKSSKLPEQRRMGNGAFCNNMLNFIVCCSAPRSQAADSNLQHWCRENAHLTQFVRLRLRVTHTLRHVSNPGGLYIRYKGGSYIVEGQFDSRLETNQCQFHPFHGSNKQYTLWETDIHRKRGERDITDIERETDITDIDRERDIYRQEERREKQIGKERLRKIDRKRERGTQCEGYERFVTRMFPVHS